MSDHFSTHLTEEDLQKCIVALYDLYMSHRPDHVDTFYVTPIDFPRIQEWYKAISLGVITISNVVENLLPKAGIKGLFTNHSLKRTSRSVLHNSGFGRDIVMKKLGMLPIMNYTIGSWTTK